MAGPDWKQIQLLGERGEREARRRRNWRRVRPDGSAGVFVEDGPRCRDCAHFVTREWAKRVFKCALTETRSARTDIRAGWGACRLFRSREGA